MATILSMPKWGLAMKTGRVVQWLKKAGDMVQQGEPIVEIESEKAVNEVEAPVSGIVRSLVVEEDENALVSAPLAVIVAEGEELSDEQVAALLREEAEKQRQQAEALSKQRSATRAGATTAGGGTRTPQSEGGRVQASPAARRLAQELGVDLTSIVGTGPKGMIGREDVLRAAEEARTASVETEAQERNIDVDGVSMHCLLAGPVDAPHIVFLHGLGGSLTTWTLNLPAFAGQFRICALDFVGAGESGKPDISYNITALTDFLARFLEVLGAEWQRVNLVGHSLGGAVALDFTGRYPERVERLVLVDSAGLGSEIDETFLHLVHSEPSPEHIRQELACFFANADLIQPSLIEQVYQQRRQPGAQKALLATADAAFKDGRQQIDLRSTLADCSKPVLLIWGAADEVVPVRHAQEVSLPNIQVNVFADCSHCPHIENSEKFNEAGMKFLGG